MDRICKNTLEVSIGIEVMTASIVIDEKLMSEALRATGLKSRKETVSLGSKL